MADTDRPVLVRRLDLDERVFAYAQVDEAHLTCVVGHAERLLKAHRFGVEGDGRIEILDGDADMIELMDAGIAGLGYSRWTNSTTRAPLRN